MFSGKRLSAKAVMASATDAKLIHTLRDLGRACANQWLAQKYASLGVACSVNIARDYLDDLRVPSHEP